MSIPTKVTRGLKAGVIGTFAFSGPRRARAAVLDSADEKNNVFGHAFTIKESKTSKEEVVEAGGKGHFAGIMVNPHVNAIADNGLAFNGTQGEFVDMGEIYVAVEGATESKIGTKVYYKEDGSLTVTEESNTLVPNCIIERHNPSKEEPNLCVIRLTN